MTYEFMEHCEQARIHPIVLPPHSTHFLQPLDVGCFQAFKYWHQEGLNRATRLGNYQFDKMDFLYLFPQMHSRTFTPPTIRHAWLRCGLIPFNPEVGLEYVRKHTTRQIIPPP